MDTPLIRIAGVALGFLLIFISGLTLSNGGRPPSTLILTFHKLLGLAMLVFLLVWSYQANQMAHLSSADLLLVVVTGAVFVGTIITGGLISANIQLPSFVFRLHQLLPFVTVLFSAAALFRLLNHR